MLESAGGWVSLPGPCRRSAHPQNVDRHNTFTWPPALPRGGLLAWSPLWNQKTVDQPAYRTRYVLPSRTWSLGARTGCSSLTPDSDGQQAPTSTHPHTPKHARVHAHTHPKLVKRAHEGSPLPPPLRRRTDQNPSMTT